jgi:hypothetical protein
MTSRNVLSVVLLGVLAFSSAGCPNKQKDGGASAEAAGSAAPGAQAPKAAEKEDDKDKDDDEDDEKDGKGEANKKDEGGW